jgi:hypothetical protein
MLNIIVLNIIVLSVIMLNIVILNVVMLSVVAPLKGDSLGRKSLPLSSLLRKFLNYGQKSFIEFRLGGIAIGLFSLLLLRREK